MTTMSDIVRLSLVEARAPSTGFVPQLRERAASAVREREPESDPELGSQIDAYSQGFAAGQTAAADVFATEHAAMAKLLAAANALQPEPSEELAAMIALTVERLVTEITGAAPVDRTWLIARVEAAVALIDDADCGRTLWLHPDDLALLENVRLAAQPRADQSLERGSLRIDCSAGWVEDGRSIHLEALRAELGITR